MTPDATEDLSAATPAGRRRLRTAEDVRKRRRRRLIAGLSVALFILVVNAIVGENGYLATLRYRTDRAALEATVARLRLENQRLQQEGRRLRDDPAALEDAARRSLGFVRPGETLVIVTPAGRPVRPGSPAR